MAAGLVAAVWGLTGIAVAKSGDDAKIRALVDNFSAAIRAKDLDKIMAIYAISVLAGSIHAIRRPESSNSPS